MADPKDQPELTRDSDAYLNDADEAGVTAVMIAITATTAATAAPATATPIVFPLVHMPSA